MRLLLTLCLVTLPLPALAQAPPPTGPISLAQAMQRSQAGIQRNIVEAAEKVAEADYAFKPTPEVRSFGQLIGHVANSQYQICSGAKGEANPNKEDFEKLAAKSALVDALKKSFDYCATAYSAATDPSLLEQVKSGSTTVARGAILSGNVAHNNEHYGNIVTYMRLKGLVPPSTERAQRKPTQ